MRLANDLVCVGPGSRRDVAQIKRHRIRATSLREELFFSGLRKQIDCTAGDLTSMFDSVLADPRLRQSRPALGRNALAELQTGQRLVERAVALLTNLCGLGSRAGKRSRLELKIASASRILYMP